MLPPQLHWVPLLTLEFADEATELLTELLLDDEGALLEGATLEELVLPVIPKGEGCALQLVAPTQL